MVSKRKSRSAGRIGAKGAGDLTAVRVFGPPGTPPGTRVAVDGNPRMFTGVPALVTATVHRFTLVSAGQLYGDDRPCAPGFTLARPFPVSVTTPRGSAPNVQPRFPQRPGVGPRVTATRPSSASHLAVAFGAQPAAQTIVYIHGIRNQPRAQALKRQWDIALFGVELGDRSRMAYWVDRGRYPEPEPGAVAVEAVAPPHAGPMVGPEDDEEAFIDGLVRDIPDAAQRRTLAAIARRMLQANSDRASDASVETSYQVASYQAESYGAKLMPFPEWMRRAITRQATAAFLPDVYDFMFDHDRREDMRASLIERLNPGGGPFIVVAHSQGSMIAFDVLRELTKTDCDIKLFLTLGSPLGIREVQDAFAGWGASLAVPACVDRWVNIADPWDPVAIDGTLGDEYAQNDKGVSVEDFSVSNPGATPHAVAGYLAAPQSRSVVREAAGSAFAQILGRSIIARDLSDDLEALDARSLHRTLIQLNSDETVAGDAADLQRLRNSLVERIDAVAAARPEDMSQETNIDEMKRFVAADLTRSEIEMLRTLFADLSIERVWRNAAKRALISRSTETVQARPAQVAYRAMGRDIGWAVLDTGIAAQHPHFAVHNNVRAQWDCTQGGQPPQPVAPGTAAFGDLDDNGHGTHVAGIIAGTMTAQSLGRVETFAGIAPETSLYGFKVLDANGNGHDSNIIKALDFIADLNEGAGRTVIHGVNLSLGGAFDPKVYGCGHTPLCQELRRLWRQGVLVCLAAGNEGYALLQSADGEIPSNLDLSIGDPANLDEAIAVGSVHKANPHIFGVSYFSSRGPTADGRVKPDVVAPGERILSAWNGYPRSPQATPPPADQFFVSLSGTSMAAPHVSGVLAAFLSVRREFIGYPDKVKEKLLASCIDLKRDRYLQGAGVPNLMHMLAHT